jgi:hypothetical protein
MLHTEGVCYISAGSQLRCICWWLGDAPLLEIVFSKGG